MSNCAFIFIRLTRDLLNFLKFYVDIYSSNLENLEPLFIHISCPSCPGLISFSKSNYIYISIFDIVPTH